MHVRMKKKNQSGVKIAVSLALVALMIVSFLNTTIPPASAGTQGSGTTNTNAVMTKVNSVDLELSSKKYIETPDLTHIINTKVNTVVYMSEGSATMDQQSSPTVTVTDQPHFSGVLKSSFNASNVKGHKTIISTVIGVIHSVTNNNLEKSMNNGDAHASVYMIEENVASLKQKALPSSAGELHFSNSFHITNSQGCSNSRDQNGFGNENALGNNIGNNPGLLDGLEYIIGTELIFESFDMDDPSADIVADLVVENLELNYDLPDSYGFDYAKYVEANDISFAGDVRFKKNLP